MLLYGTQWLKPDHPAKFETERVCEQMQPWMAMPSTIRAAVCTRLQSQTPPCAPNQTEGWETAQIETPVDSAAGTQSDQTDDPRLPQACQEQEPGPVKHQHLTIVRGGFLFAGLIRERHILGASCPPLYPPAHAIDCPMFGTAQMPPCVGLVGQTRQKASLNDN